jgi:hypothetical protein
LLWWEGIRVVPYYYYEAATTEGRITRRILKARDKKDVDHRLRESGLRPMLIENYRTTKKKKKQKALHTRHIIRNTLAAVSGISVVGGVAAYLIVLDLSSTKSQEVQNLAKRGIVDEVAESIIIASDEVRPFATGVMEELNAAYPDTFGGITIEHKYLMLIYVKNRRNLTNADLRQITSLLATTFQKRFDLKSCMVQMVHNKKTIAQGSFRFGEEMIIDVF